MNRLKDVFLLDIKLAKIIFYPIYFFVTAFFYMLYGIYTMSKATSISKKYSEERSRAYLRPKSKKFGQRMFTWVGMRPEIEGMENLPKEQSYIIMSNHQSYLDPMLILGFISPDTYLLAKQELNAMPFFKQAMDNFCVTIDRNNPQKAARSLRRILNYIKDGKIISMFPEGTRSTDGELREFMQGAVKLAYKSKKPVVPLIIEGTRFAMPKGKWMIRNRRILASIKKPLNPADFPTKEAFEERLRTVMKDEVERLKLRYHEKSKE